MNRRSAVLPQAAMLSQALERSRTQSPSRTSRPELADGFEARPTQRKLVSLQAAAATPNLFASNDILGRYQPTGASAATARQDGLPAGVSSSHRMADADRPHILKHKDKLMSAAARYGVPPAVLAAIASRESRGGTALDRNGTGDKGNGFGMMQVDKRYHTPAGGPFSQEHINQAASILRNYLDGMKAKFPSWPPEQQMRGAIVSYNSDIKNVQTLAGMDRGTTGNDYSNDVWARAIRLAKDFGGAVGSSPTTPVDPVDPNPTTPVWTDAPSFHDVRNTPNTFLKKGMEGEPVKQLQKLLGIPESERDGKFGEATRQAVIAFQKANGLTPPPGKEGWVGKTTLEHLEKAAFPEDPNATYTEAPSLEDVRTKPNTFLHKGMEGEAVSQLQRMLGLGETMVSGRFDERTHQAVLDFQKDNGLTPPAGKEGWVGATTLQFLEKASGPVDVDDPDEPTYTQAPSLDDVRTVPETFLKQGMQGESVKELQQLLGFAAADRNGLFDEKTQAAVEAFQKAKGLVPPAGKEGWVGKTTLESLEKAAQGADPVVPKPGTWTPAPSLADVLAGKGTLKQGMEGAAVKELQKLLGFPTGEQDGKFGKMTHDAVVAFQKQNGLVPPPGMEGVVGKTTLENLQKERPATGGGNIRLPLMRQGDSPIAKIRSVGCGIASVAMTIKGLTGKNVTPESIYKQYGFYLRSALTSNGVKLKEHSSLHTGSMNTEDKAWKVFSEATAKGNPVIFAANGPTFSPSGRGHIMAATGTSVVNGQRMLSFNDPATGTNRTVPFRELWNASRHPDGNFVWECAR
jgi:peptidoglycan hydrolase-like protein with peptidoglycan-binding domain